MRTRRDQTGFSLIEVVIAAVVVGTVGLLGYVGYNQMNKTKSSSETPTTSVNQAADSAAIANDVATVPQIASAADLNNASTTLDQTDLDSSESDDVTQLDDQLSNF